MSVMMLDAPAVIRVGSRKSQLALLQTNLVVDLLQKYYPNYRFDIVKISTTGDKILDKALSKIGDKNLFTKELEVALLNNEVDFVVHSLKDVPTAMPEGLVIGCICARISPFDVVLMNPDNRGKKLKDLPPSSVIGTSALRRIAVLKRQFPNLCFESVRGNLTSRLQKLDASAIADSNGKDTVQKYDALILAEAGVLRVGWQSRIDEYLNLDRYAVGQGALACECRQGDARIQALLSTIHNEAPALACIAERAFMSRLEGGCSTPIAVRTQINPGGVAGIEGDEETKARTLTLDAAVLSLDGSKCVEGKMSTELPFSMPWDCPKRARMEQSCCSMFVNDEITEIEEQCAVDENAIILGVQVSPICCIGRLRMVRARSLGEALADRMHAAGAGEILDEIRATGTSKSDPVKPKETQESTSPVSEAVEPSSTSSIPTTSPISL